MKYHHFMFISVFLLVIVGLAGLGVSPASAAMSTSQSELIFSVQSGDASITRSVTLTYTGGSAVTVNTPTFTGNNPTLFELINPPAFPVVLQNGQTLTLSVHFIPDDADIGTFNAVLNVPSTDATSPTQISLYGLSQDYYEGNWRATI